MVLRDDSSPTPSCLIFTDARASGCTLRRNLPCTHAGSLRAPPGRIRSGRWRGGRRGRSSRRRGRRRKGSGGWCFCHSAASPGGRACLGEGFNRPLSGRSSLVKLGRASRIALRIPLQCAVGSLHTSSGITAGGSCFCPDNASVEVAALPDCGHYSSSSLHFDATASLQAPMCACLPRRSAAWQRRC